MTKLDDIQYVHGLDRSNMLRFLLTFPEQLRDGAVPSSLPQRAANTQFSNIVLSGLGGSAIAGDIVKCCLAGELTIPFLVNRDYGVPGFVNAQTLFFASSYSGNTEETLSAYEMAKKRGAQIVVIASGGKLSAMAQKDGCPVTALPAGVPPRAGIGYSLVAVLNILSQAGLIKNKARDIDEAVSVLASLRDEAIGPAVPLKANIAKKIAATVDGRMCAVYGWSRSLECVVMRWRNQMNENSKSFAASHLLPEMCHNEIMGFRHPKKVLKEMVVIFLKDSGEHGRITQRAAIMSSVIKNRVHRIIAVETRGRSLLARICSLLYIGDFVSLYLAILNREDPTPVDEITYLKKQLARRAP